MRERHRTRAAGGLQSKVPDYIRGLLDGVSRPVRGPGDLGVEQARTFTVIGGADASCAPRQARDDSALEQTLQVDNQVIRARSQLTKEATMMSDEATARKPDDPIDIVEARNQVDVFVLRNPVDLGLEVGLQRPRDGHGMNEVAERTELHDQDAWAPVRGARSRI